MPATPQDVAAFVRRRISDGHYETWFNSTQGRSLAFVTNGLRAMVMLLDHDDDPGQHAVDRDATGTSAGFLLTNGQQDSYPDRDTVALALGVDVVAAILTSGRAPTDAVWEIVR